MARWSGAADGGVQAAAGAERAAAAAKSWETNEEERPAAWARDINDMRAPRFFLMPVDPMLGFRTPVKCIGSVHPRLQQICI